MATANGLNPSFDGTVNSDTGFTVNGQAFTGMVETGGNKYFVSRNKTASGDGKTWANAFKTITEGFAALNADYTAAAQPNKGRNGVLYIGEGYYSEVPVTLTANDCTIICTAPGHHDSTVFYGSGTAGSFAGTTTAPAITISGSNNTIYGLGVVNISGGLQPAIKIADGATSNRFINCTATKDVVDSCTYGIEDFGNAFTWIEGCEFTTSCKTAGIRMYSATNNGIQQVIKNCLFYGTPAGIIVDAASHNLLIQGNTFSDDTSDTADVIDTPILNNGGVSINVRDNYAWTTTANLVTGSGTSKEANNFQLA